MPAMVRWPGQIEPGQVLNGIVSHNDWFPTLLAAAGVPDIADQLKAGADLDGTTYKVHLDGHNQLPYLTGEVDESPRQHFFYVSDDGDLTGAPLRHLEGGVPRAAGRRARSASGPSPSPSCGCRRSSTCAPIPTSGPTSPRTPTATGCSTTPGSSCPRQAYVAQMLTTLVEFPPSQKPASFSLEQVMAKLEAGMPSA